MVRKVIVSLPPVKVNWRLYLSRCATNFLFGKPFFGFLHYPEKCAHRHSCAPSSWICKIPSKTVSYPQSVLPSSWYTCSMIAPDSMAYRPRLFQPFVLRHTVNFLHSISKVAVITVYRSTILPRNVVRSCWCGSPLLYRKLCPDIS